MSKWEPMESAPQDETLLAIVDGAVRLIRWGKTSHVPMVGFCLADQGAEDFDLCSPTAWMRLPPLLVSTSKSPWQVEFDALPAWAQKMITALSRCSGYGALNDPALLSGFAHPERYGCVHLILKKDAVTEWWDAFDGAKDLANAMTAPWPPPEAPKRERRVFNVVELAADAEGDESAFDQPCAFGNHVINHAVYCHNEAWPNSPRKCRRQLSGDFVHADCPGYVANPDYK